MMKTLKISATATRIKRVILLVAVLLTSGAPMGLAQDDEDSAPALDTYNKAVHFYETKHWYEAKEYLHRYLAEYSDTPLYVTCLYYLAYCYQQLGNTKQASLLYNTVIDQAKGPDAFWGDMAQHRLEELK